MGEPVAAQTSNNVQVLGVILRCLRWWVREKEGGDQKFDPKEDTSAVNCEILYADYDAFSDYWGNDYDDDDDARDTQ